MKFGMVLLKEGRRYRFEDLGTHWPGSSDYTQYIRDEEMRTGEISVWEHDDNVLIYDLVLYSRTQKDGGASKEKEKRCWLPSPVGGTLIEVGEGANSVTTIKMDRKNTSQNTSGNLVKMLHMDIIIPKVGDKIEKGAIIGRQGAIMDSKKVSSNVHLHIQCSRTVLKDYIKLLVDVNSLKRPTDIEIEKNKSSYTIIGTVGL